MVTFRNIHNWTWQGMEKDVEGTAFKALKPGGILGVEEHRNNDPRLRAEGSRAKAYVGDYGGGEDDRVGGFQATSASR